MEETAKDVGDIAMAVVMNHKLDFDFEGRFESIIKKLAAAGQIGIAKELCNQDGVKDIPAIIDLYAQLRERH